MLQPPDRLISTLNNSDVHRMHTQHPYLLQPPGWLCVFLPLWQQTFFLRLKGKQSFLKLKQTKVLASITAMYITIKENKQHAHTSSSPVSAAAASAGAATTGSPDQHLKQQRCTSHAHAASVPVAAAGLALRFTSL